MCSTLLQFFGSLLLIMHAYILHITEHYINMIKGMMIKVLAKVLVFYSVMAVPRGCTKFEIITTVINFPEWLLLSEKELNLVPWEINNIVKYFIIVSKIFEEATSNKHGISRTSLHYYVRAYCILKIS